MIKNSLLVIAILTCCMLGQLSLVLDIDWLQYAKPEIETGQWWRLISANLIHLNWRHFALNALAFIAIYLLFPRLLQFSSMLVVFLLSCLSVTVGLWMFEPEIYWYVGLSGALHGILVTLLILDFAANRNMLALAVMVLIIAKLIWEGFLGPLPGSESTVGGPVVVQAHLYGALGGVIFAAYFLVINLIKTNK